MRQPIACGLLSKRARSIACQAKQNGSVRRAVVWRKGYLPGVTNRLKSSRDIHSCGRPGRSESANVRRTVSGFTTSLKMFTNGVQTGMPAITIKSHLSTTRKGLAVERAGHRVVDRGGIKIKLRGWQRAAA